MIIRSSYRWISVLACAACAAAGMLAAPPSVAPAEATPAPAASSKVAVTAPQVRHLWWVADAMARNPDLAQLVFLERTLQTLYAENPTLSATTATALVSRLRSAIRTRGGSGVTGDGNQALPAVVNAARAGLASGTWDKRIVEAAKVSFQYFEGSAVAAGAEAQVEDPYDLVDGSQVLLTSAPSVLGSLIGAADDGHHAALRTAQNELFGSTTAAVGTAAKTIAARDGALSGLATLKLSSDGSLHTTEAALQNAEAAQLSKLATANAATANAVTAVVASQPDLANTGTTNATAAATADKDSKDEKNKTTATEAASSVITAILNEAFPAQAKIEKAAVQSAVQIAGAIEKFAETVAQKGFDVSFDSAAGASMTGTIISAVFTLISALSDANNPDPTLQAIGDLRQQITDLGTELNQRFDHVDQQLADIYALSVNDFNTLNLTLGRVDGNVEQALNQLETLQARTTTLQGGLWSAISDSAREKLWDEIDSALGYRARTGKPLTDAAFLTADSTFYTWATVHAYDAASNPVDDRSYSLDDAADELAAYSVADQYGYLNRFAGTLGLPPVTTATPPSLHAWYVAARAYLALAESYPTDAQANRQLASEAADIEQGGTALEQFMTGTTKGATPWTLKSQSLDGTSSTGPSVTLPTLYADLLAAYDQAKLDLADGIANDEAEWVEAETSHADPWAGDDQQVRVPGAPQTSQLECQALTSLSPAMPDSTVNRLLPGYLRFAQSDVNQGAPQLCVSAYWSDEKDTVSTKVTSVWYKLHVDLTTSWTDTAGARQTIESGSYVSGYQAWCSYLNDGPPTSCNQPYSPGQYLTSNWSSLLAYFATARVTENSALATAIHTADQDYLYRQRRAELAQITQDLASGSLHEPLQRLAGAQAAIRAYAQAGMPAVYQRDEVLEAMTAGDQRLTDGDQIVAAYDAQAAAADPVEPWAGLTGPMAERETALAKVIARDAALPDAHAAPDLETTMERLQALAPTLTTTGLTYTPVVAATTKVGSQRTITVRVTNAGLNTLKVTRAKVSGAGLRMTGSTCAHVAAHATCAETLRYTPTKAGHPTGHLTLTTNTIRGTVVIAVPTKAVPRR